MAGIQIYKPITQRFPSKGNALLVFSACIFPIHTWITIVFLYNFPSLILRANIWQIVGVLAYSLVFALIESTFLFGFLTLLAVLLPHRIFKFRFVQIGTFLALVITGFALLLNTQFMQQSSWVWLPVIGATVVGLFAVLLRPIKKSRTKALAERFMLISSLYFALDLVALLYLTVSFLLV